MEFLKCEDNFFFKIYIIMCEKLHGLIWENFKTQSYHSFQSDLLIGSELCFIEQFIYASFKL